MLNKKPENVEHPRSNLVDRTIRTCRACGEKTRGLEEGYRHLSSKHNSGELLQSLERDGHLVCHFRDCDFKTSSNIDMAKHIEDHSAHEVVKIFMLNKN